MGNRLSNNGPSSLRELANRRNEHEAQLTKDDIERELRAVASAMHAKKRNPTIVTVGGVVNAILLETRASTGDVDFFLSHEIGK
ncbi:hypothetical protein BS17DRAFT_881282 [Gyrodon lividus]|nr:hypothetical protein BS17DRAFT_881282 [Gyrodon lividus]